MNETNTGMSIAQSNAMARSLVLQNALPMMQQVYQTTIAAPGQASNVVNVSPRYVGLIKGFLVKISGTITNNNSASSGAAITPTALGPSNFLSRVAFSDLSNNLRHNSAGWHFAAINSAKRRQPFGSAVTNTSYPVGYGNNYPTMVSAPASIAAGATGAVNMYYYVPLAYSDSDLRGAIYANVVNATMQLQLTINPNPSVASGNSVLSMYSGNDGTLSNVTVTVYQDYLDQLPVITESVAPLANAGMRSGGVILPMADISKVYMLQDTSFSGISQSLDFPMPYANYRDFFSTVAIYDNGGSLNAGTDVNYFAVQAANYTNMQKLDPITWSLLSRNRMRCDFPAGMYYFDHRERPLASVQYGNLELVLNASTVNSNARVITGYEMIARQQIIQSAGSLPGG